MAQLTNPMSSYAGMTPEEIDIARKQKLAERLQAQADQPLQGQMVGNIYVAPSWTQGLAKLLNSYQAGKVDREADQQTKDYRQKMSDMLRGTMAQGNVTTEGPAGPTMYQVDGVEKPFASRSEAEQYINANDPKQELGSALYGEFGGNNQLPANTDFGQYAGAPYVAPSMAPKMGITEVPGQPTKTTTFDFNRVMQAAMQNPDNPLFGTAMNYMAEQQKLRTPRNQFGAVMPGNYTPESLAAFQQSGNYGDLVPVMKGAQFGQVNPGQFTPESLALYAQTGNYADLVPFRAPVQVDQGPTKTLVYPGTNKRETFAVTPKIEETPGFKAAQATAVETAKTGVERAKDAADKTRNANSLISYIDEAEGILNEGNATGSIVGSAVASGKKAFGVSDASTQANKRLENIGAWMTANVPRMQGPQSDADRVYYQQMAGQVGDKTVPVKDRLAALKQLRVLQEKYKNIQGFNPPSNGTPQGNVMTPAEIKRLEPAMNYLQGAQTQEELSKRVKTLKQKGWSDDDIRRSYGNQ